MVLMGLVLLLASRCELPSRCGGQNRDDNVISCGKLTIINCQPQGISAGFGELRGSHWLGRVAKGYLSGTSRLLPTVSYRSIGLAIICGRSIQGRGIRGARN